MKTLLTLVVVGQLYAGEPPTVSVLSFDMPDMMSCMEMVDSQGVQGVSRKYWQQHREVQIDEVFYQGYHILAIHLQCNRVLTLPQ